MTHFHTCRSPAIIELNDSTREKEKIDIQKIILTILKHVENIKENTFILKEAKKVGKKKRFLCLSPARFLVFNQDSVNYVLIC